MGGNDQNRTEKQNVVLTWFLTSDLVVRSSWSPNLPLKGLCGGLSEGSAGSLRGFCGPPQDFPRFFGGSDPVLVTFGNCWKIKSHSKENPKEGVSGTEKVPQRTCATKILPNFRVNFLVRFASKPWFYWVVPSNCSDNSLVLFVRFFGFGVLFLPLEFWGFRESSSKVTPKVGFLFDVPHETYFRGYF